MSFKDFRYQAAGSRVVFGQGVLGELAAEAEHLGMRRVLVLSTPGRHGYGDKAAALLGDRLAGVFAGAAMHTPVDVTRAALDVVKAAGADGVVSIGGGSAIGLGKAIALRTDLPQIVVPTTYAGSEATSILGETADGVKTTQRSPRILPETIIYDVDLTLSLPSAVSMTSGLNAIAHAAEALYADDGAPLIGALAVEGVAALVGALPKIHLNPLDVGARRDALYGAWLCGTCLGAVSMALHHKICHTLGGTFGLPHAETHAIMLPHALAYNLAAAPQARARLAPLFNHHDPAIGLEMLARGLDVPRALRDIGMPQDGLDQAADLAVRNPYANPRPIEREAIRAMLDRAWFGDAPDAGIS